MSIFCFGRPFHSLNGFFWEVEVSNFDKVQVLHFSTYDSQEIFVYHKITKLLTLRGFAVLAFVFNSMALLGCHLRAQSIQWDLFLLDRWGSKVPQPCRSSGISWPEHVGLVIQRLKVLPRQFSAPPSLQSSPMSWYPANSSHLSCSELWLQFPQLIKIRNIPWALAWARKCLHEINWDKHSFFPFCLGSQSFIAYCSLSLELFYIFQVHNFYVRRASPISVTHQGWKQMFWVGF